MAEEITRREQFYAAILGEGQIPEPKTREEQYLQRIAQNGGGGGGTTNYNDLSNKPQINSVTLQGDQSISDLFDGKVDIGVGTVDESGYAELKDENGDRIFRAGSANGGAAIESGALIGQSGALVLYNGEGGLSSVRPKSGVSLVDVDLPAENGTLALDSQIASSQTPAKAAVVTVPDAAPINAEDITVDITPVQDLHGYDRPWAGGGGKNKLPMTVAGIKAANTNGTWSGNTYTFNGVTFTLLTDTNDNVVGISVNGTATANTNLFVGTASEEENYIVNGCPAGGSYSSSYSIWAVSDSPYAESVDAGTGTTIADYYERSIRIRIANGYTATNLIFYPMIRLSTETDPTFAPYTNICPIEGWTGAELDRVGKNWLHPTVARLKTINQNADWTGNTCRIYGVDFEILTDAIGRVIGVKATRVSASSTNALLNIALSSDLQEVRGKSVIMSGCCYGGSSNLYLQFYKYDDDNSTACLAYNTDTQPFTPNIYSNNTAVRIVVKSTSNPNNGIFYPMIRLASITDSTYEPYQGQQYTADFGETVHGGKWHVTEGGTDNEMAEVDLGTLTWVYNSTTVGKEFFYANLSPLPKRAISASSVANVICSIYQSASGNAVYNHTIIPSCGIPHDRDIVMVCDTAYSDATAFKTAMSGVQLVYELATPTTISTPKQNVPMLQGINTVSADCGDTQLKYQPDNVIGELKGEIQELESELDKLDKAYMASDTFSERGIDGEYQITRIGNEIHIAAIIDDASIATQTGSVDLIADLPDAFRCNGEYTAVLALRHSSGTGKIEFKINPGITTQNFYMYVEEVNTTSGVWFPIYDVPGKVL